MGATIRIPGKKDVLGDDVAYRSRATPRNEAARKRTSTLRDTSGMRAETLFSGCRRHERLRDDLDKALALAAKQSPAKQHHHSDRRGEDAMKRATSEIDAAAQLEKRSKQLASSLRSARRAPALPTGRRSAAPHARLATS